MRAVGAKITGRKHKESRGRCEDNFCIEQTEDGYWTAAVVCDGCGSVKNAAEGAEFISKFMVGALFELVPKIKKEGPGEWVIDDVVISIVNLRNSMRRYLGERIDDYASTIVGVLFCREGGFFVHIGDGIGTALKLGHDNSLEFSAQSDPKNGEFINQTFYPTEYNWIKHINITPFSKSDVVILCSDGAQEVIYDGNIANIDKIVNILRSGPNKNEDLEMIFDGMGIYDYSGDDIGVVLIYNDGIIDNLKSSNENITSPNKKYDKNKESEINHTEIKNNRFFHLPRIKILKSKIWFRLIAIFLLIVILMTCGIFIGKIIYQKSIGGESPLTHDKYSICDYS